MADPEASRALSAGGGRHEVQALVRQLAARLGETKREPLALLARIVCTLGPEHATALAEQALALYAGEGLLTARGDRKRTAGGIFFHLAKQQATPKQHRRMQFWLGSDRQRPRRPMGTQPEHPAPPNAPAPLQAPQQKPATTLAEIAARVRLEPGAGTLTTTSVKLIGRPGTVETHGALTCFVLTAERVPALPKSLPAMQAGTQYLVLVGSKQWQKVAGALEADSEARFVIEGYPTVQPGFAGIAVAALNCALLARKHQEG
jgi:hypothetical protein